MPANARLRDFFCPLCQSNHCKFVTVRAKSGQIRVVEGLFECAGCSVIFADPQAFTYLVRDTFLYERGWRERVATRDYPPDSTGPFKPDKFGKLKKARAK